MGYLNLFIQIVEYAILLTQVYINESNVDDYLVESITRPAADPNAGEVYYRYLDSRYVTSPVYGQGTFTLASMWFSSNNG